MNPTATLFEILPLGSYRPAVMAAGYGAASLVAAVIIPGPDAALTAVGVVALMVAGLMAFVVGMWRGMEQRYLWFATNNPELVYPDDSDKAAAHAEPFVQEFLASGYERRCVMLEQAAADHRRLQREAAAKVEARRLLATPERTHRETLARIAELEAELGIGDTPPSDRS